MSIELPAPSGFETLTVVTCVSFMIACILRRELAPLPPLDGVAQARFQIDWGPPAGFRPRTSIVGANERRVAGRGLDTAERNQMLALHHPADRLGDCAHGHRLARA